MKNEYEGAAAVPRLEPLGLPPETAEQAGQSGQPPAAAVALRLAVWLPEVLAHKLGAKMCQQLAGLDLSTDRPPLPPKR